MSTSFIEDLWSSVFTPGPTPTLLIATNVTFAALQIVLFILLIATYSMHFVALSFISGALWWSINWFAKEVREVQAQQQEEERKKLAEGSDTSAKGWSTTENHESETETETESGTKSKARRRKVNQSDRTSATTATSMELQDSTDDISRKRESVGGDGSGYTSTDSEWEKVDKDKTS